MKLAIPIEWNGRTYTHLDGAGVLWRFDGARPVSTVGDEMRQLEIADGKVDMAGEESEAEEIFMDFSYFGLPSPGSSWLDGAERMDVPVGKPCCLCNVAIVAEDSGFCFVAGPYIHNQCFLQIIGCDK